MKTKSWERSLVDDSLGNDVKGLLKKAEEWEKEYLKSLPKPGECGSQILACLIMYTCYHHHNNCVQCHNIIPCTCTYVDVTTTMSCTELS